MKQSFSAKEGFVIKSKPNIGTFDSNITHVSDTSELDAHIPGNIVIQKYAPLFPKIWTSTCWIEIEYYDPRKIAYNMQNKTPRKNEPINNPNNPRARPIIVFTFSDQNIAPMCAYSINDAIQICEWRNKNIDTELLINIAPRLQELQSQKLHKTDQVNGWLKTFAGVQMAHALREKDWAIADATRLLEEKWYMLQAQNTFLSINNIAEKEQPSKHKDVVHDTKDRLKETFQAQ